MAKAGLTLLDSQGPVSAGRKSVPSEDHHPAPSPPLSDPLAQGLQEGGTRSNSPLPQAGGQVPGGTGPVWPKRIPSFHLTDHLQQAHPGPVLFPRNSKARSWSLGCGVGWWVEGAWRGREGGVLVPGSPGGSRCTSADSASSPSSLPAPSPAPALARGVRAAGSLSPLGRGGGDPSRCTPPPPPPLPPGAKSAGCWPPPGLQQRAAQRPCTTAPAGGRRASAALSSRRPPPGRPRAASAVRQYPASDWCSE